MGNKKKDFLWPTQVDALKKMRNGCILNGGVGSGKSRTGLYYYFKQQGGYIPLNKEDDKEFKYLPPNSKDLYIITTARKRDTLEWEGELAPFLLSTNEKEQSKRYGNKIVVDSWNNIKKYIDISNAFFIFDEQRAIGYGTWGKSFIKISKENDWIMLTATPGDNWMDYIPVFIANGFYKNKTQFVREHVIYSRYSKYPKIDRYVNTVTLEFLRDRILIPMDTPKRKIERKHFHLYNEYNKDLYKQTIRRRWNPYEDKPLENANELCLVLRRIVNEDDTKQKQLLEILDTHDKVIIFYTFNYELDILRTILPPIDGLEVAEWNGHKHELIPDSDRWAYLVQYTAGAEGWNCIETDTMIFFSPTYSYKTLKQACGRIDRANTPFDTLYYYHLKSRSGIDISISQALKEKREFNEYSWASW